MPVWVKEIPFSVDLERTFAHLYKQYPYAFWLDGNRLVQGLSRYSFLGGNPRLLVRVEQGKTYTIERTEAGRWQDPVAMEAWTEQPFDAIQQILNRYHQEHIEYIDDEQVKLPFVAGLVGYFGYEMKRYVEDVPTRTTDLTEVPESLWMFVDQVLIYDQVEQKAYLSYLQKEEREQSQIEWELDKIISELKRVQSLPLAAWEISPVTINEQRFSQQETFASYIGKIEKIKEHIERGDIYQACFTHQISAETEVEPFDLYRTLRRVNPAPFSCYLQLGEWSILSSSPERFIKLNEERVVESRPIKGTRPRSNDIDEDQRLVEELRHSVKDRAENVMIVDLVRNDLGRVCESGTVTVPTLLNVESYATVHQLVSTVEGRLDESHQPLDAIKAAFPGGSMTGAPKIRALQILHELEPMARGVYAGGLGYLDVRGPFDLSMVIRTMIHHRNRIYFHVGGGIVADSDPVAEYQESLDKAFALKKALLSAETAHCK